MTRLEMITAIEGFRNLGEDWDSYGAIPIREDTVQLALYISGVLPPGEWGVYPQHDGEIWFEQDGEFTGNEQKFSIISVFTDSITVKEQKK